MDKLNYHHLRYFREVAREGHLTRAAEKVNLSQSALSLQIRTLEERLGHALFDRKGRQLVLTEVGRIALDYADRIFSTGEELLATLDRSTTDRPPLRIGALSTLSRNFQMRFLQPVLDMHGQDVVLRSGSERVLYDNLRALSLDVLLTTEPPRADMGTEFTAHRLAEQTVGLHAIPERLNYQSLTDLLTDEPLIVPTESALRRGFDSLMARLDIHPRIVADVDDMAMVRLLARAGVGVAVAPDVVLADEITSGRLATAPLISISLTAFTRSRRDAASHIRCSRSFWTTDDASSPYRRPVAACHCTLRHHLHVCRWRKSSRGGPYGIAAALGICLRPRHGRGVQRPDRNRADRRRTGVRLKGQVSLENNGGFVQMAFDLPRSGINPAAWTGIEFDVYGNGEAYDVRLRTTALTRPWQSFRAGFVAEPRWRTVRIPFSDFEAHRTEAVFDSATLRRIGILAIGRVFEAEVTVARVGFYRD